MTSCALIFIYLAVICSNHVMSGNSLVCKISLLHKVRLQIVKKDKLLLEVQNFVRIRL